VLGFTTLWTRVLTRPFWSARRCVDHRVIDHNNSSSRVTHMLLNRIKNHHRAWRLPTCHKLPQRLCIVRLGTRDKEDDLCTSIQNGWIITTQSTRSLSRMVKELKYRLCLGNLWCFFCFLCGDDSTTRKKPATSIYTMSIIPRKARGWGDLGMKELHAHLDFAAAVDVKLLRLLYHTVVLEVS
jgi:hypothetical protein